VSEGTAEDDRASQHTDYQGPTASAAWLSRVNPEVIPIAIPIGKLGFGLSLLVFLLVLHSVPVSTERLASDFPFFPAAPKMQAEAPAE
jgi:hypothetical protein